MQLDELEYFLLGLYPSVVFSIKGKLLFQGLKGRHYDGVVIRTALAENDWTNPWSLSPPLQNLLEVHWLSLSVCTMSPSSRFSLFKTLVPLPEAFPPPFFLYFLGPYRMSALFSPSCAARSFGVIANGEDCNR